MKSNPNDGFQGSRRRGDEALTSSRHASSRRRLQGAVVSACIAIGICTAAPKPPNVILVLTDDQGYGDMGFAGNCLVRTPHMDAMAKRSTRMENFYVCPACTPTRASLMTGRYNYRTKAIDTFLGRAMMDPGEITVAQVLNRAGYATGIFGKWHLGDTYPIRAMDKGFEEALVIRGGGIGQPSNPPGGEGKYTDPILFRNGKPEAAKGYCTDVYFAEGMRWAERESKKGRPFFLYLPTNAPHGPFGDVPPDKLAYYKQQVIAPDRFPKTPGHPVRPDINADELARVYAMIENIDDNLGRLFAWLDREKLTDNTLVLFLTDNGEATWGYNAGLRDRKTSPYEGGIKSPLLACWPGKLQPGVCSDRITAHIDLMPTILEVCGVPLPGGLKIDGRSLMPLWNREPGNWPERTLFFQMHRGDMPVRYHNCSVRTQKWKLVHGTGFGSETFTGPLKLELFDMATDPYELHDVSAEHPDIVTDLKGRYDAWFDDVGSTRPDNYSPVRIPLGTPQENPVVLNRQDWRGIVPAQKKFNGHWLVDVTAASNYDVTLRFKPLNKPSIAHFELGEAKREQPVDPEDEIAVFKDVPLPAGPGQLEAFLTTGKQSIGVMFVEVSLPGTAAPLSIRLGEANEESGLSVPSGGDGANVPRTIAGSPCRRISGENARYLYVKADATRVPVGDSDAWLRVEYYDDRPQIARVEYDLAPEVKEKNTYYASADDLILLTGSKQWQRAVIHLPHARFGHGQNYQADLRLAGRDLAVRRIEVAFTRPDDYRTGGFDPAKLEAVRTRIGPGLELDLGCNATPAEAALYRMLGFTCVESYVTWQTVEDAGEGQWDWSHWDKQVETLRSAGLKWAPLIVCGPAYSLPKWFRESNRSVPYVCLEHGEKSKIQSLWDPKFRFWVDRFIRAFAEHYRDSGMLELVRLGVTGIYGETLYPSGPSTGWAFSIAGTYHNHTGWWAGDALAVQSFRDAMRKKYGDIAALNQAWGTSHPSFNLVAPMLPAKLPCQRARLDFVGWYVDSMTELSAFWASTVRKHFPKTPIYQSLGGSGEPVLGADFSAQAKAGATFGVRLRVTNEGSDYAANFACTREVISAGRAFGLDYGLEPASHVSAEGNVARIYNATTSGAAHLFCYKGNILQDQESLALFRESAPFFQRRKPVVHAALYLPKTSWELDDAALHRTLKMAQTLRRSVDLELLDRTTFQTPLARQIKVLVVADAPYAEPSEIAALRDWVAAGGILLARTSAENLLLRTPEGSDANRDKFLSLPPSGKKLLKPKCSGQPTRHFRLSIGAGDEAYLAGDWYGIEPGAMVSQAEGAKMRWTRARAGCYLPCDPSSDATLVLTANLLPQSLPGPNQVLVHGKAVGTLDRTGPQTFRFPIPKHLLAGSSVAEISLSIRTFRPKQATDARDLGVAISSFELFAQGAEQTPPTSAPLEWEVDWTQAAPLVRPTGRGATLTLTSQNSPELSALLIESLVNPGQFIPGAQGIRLPPSMGDSVFATELSDGFLYYNSSAEPCSADSLTIPAHGIAWNRMDAR